MAGNPSTFAHAGMMLSSPPFLFGSTPQQLLKRQDGKGCEPGWSPCHAVNVDRCCPNDHYCYVKPNGEGACCPNDNDSFCDDPCSRSSYRCTVSSTTTCCPRPCSAPSSFQCPQSLGGFCCEIGFACITGNSCSQTVHSATSSTESVSATRCASGQAGCSLPGGVPAATSPAPAPTEAAGISDGAKAGIAAGVTVVGVLLLALLGWFIVTRRRRGATPAAAPAVYMSAVSSPGGTSTGEYFASETANRAVPITPQGPGDIAAPVEIGLSMADSTPHDAGEHDPSQYPRRPSSDPAPMGSIIGRTELPS